MIYISNKKSRLAAEREALSHGLVPNHVYSIKKYEGYGNWLVASSSEGESAMQTYKIYGLRWFLLRGLVFNITSRVLLRDEEAVREWFKMTGEQA